MLAIKPSENHLSKLVARRSYRLNRDLLRQTRLAHGLTQIELANLSGYSERVIRKAESEGRAAGSTIEDLVDTLAEQGAPLKVSELLLSPLMVCQEFMQLFEEHDQHVLRFCGNRFADDFVFQCAGPESSPIAGEFKGIIGFQAWLDQFFGLFQRVPDHQLNPTFLQRDGTVLARYEEIVMAGNLVSPPIWVNLHFAFDDCTIVRLTDEYDTQVGFEFLERVASSQSGQ